MNIKYKIVFHDNNGEVGQITMELMGPILLNHHIRSDNEKYRVFEVIHTYDHIELHVI